MLGVYLFAAVLGCGLLVFSFGDDHGGQGHGVDVHHGFAGAIHPHVGDVLLGFFRPRNLIFFLAAFGLTGSLLTWLGTSFAPTLLAAAGMGTGALLVTGALFRWLGRSDSAMDVVGDAELEGTMARVVIPVGEGQRGRIACTIGGREVHLIARLAPGVGQALETGREVVVVRMADGEAEISPFGNNS